MRLEFRQLAQFWEAASQSRPLIVVGAGRWGRTLLAVAAAARGSSDHLAIVARSNYEDTRRWRLGRQRLDGVIVTASVDSAVGELQTSGRRPVALVATRPRDHYADAARCLDLGLDVLVEKPLVGDAADAERLVKLAATTGRALALGVEYSMLPAFHYAAQQLRGRVTSADIQWQDPGGEDRHGQIKRPHVEVHAVDDILPHALSVFRIIRSERSALRVVAARWIRPPDRAEAILAGEHDRLSWHVDRAASTRERRLRVTTEDGSEIVVDFSTPSGSMAINGDSHEIPVEWRRMDSTVRLEMGAFFEHCDHRAVATPLTEGLLEYARVQDALRDALASPK